MVMQGALLGSAWPFAGGLASGLTGGILSGLTGVGGGFILLPMLRLLLGVQQREAQAVTLAALLLPISLPALLHYHRHGIPLHWGLAGAIVLGFLPGVWAGAELAQWLPEGPLEWTFVAFLLLLAAWTAYTALRPVAARPPPMATPGWQRLDQGGVVGLVGGLCSGLLGVGGGVVMLPILLLWLRLPQLQAQLLSLAVMILPIRLPGLLVYLRGSSDFPWPIFLGLASGFALGTYLGARFAMTASVPRLRVGLAGLMLATAGVMVWKA